MDCEVLLFTIYRVDERRVQGAQMRLPKSKQMLDALQIPRMRYTFLWLFLPVDTIVVVVKALARMSAKASACLLWKPLNHSTSTSSLLWTMILQSRYRQDLRFSFSYTCA